ncbi:hypothetical protein CTA1_1786 [Colletotrichum tanaceti]|uniref:Uncharacterized protein n=1 Tax=Colletotrichum tanaceti TaxID=1306861 RepID=A0A4U6XHA9_9PEZI|nr:hypothetical protein CTA1_1786 [Colletotrichum tanaceti]
MSSTVSPRFSVEAQNAVAAIRWSRSKISLHINPFIPSKLERPKDMPILIIAHIKLDGESYIILERKRHEAGKKHYITAPAKIYKPGAALGRPHGETSLKAEIFARSVDSIHGWATIELEASSENNQVKTEDGITNLIDLSKMETLYLPKNKLYEKLQKLQQFGLEIDNHLMSWALRRKESYECIDEVDW